MSLKKNIFMIVGIVSAAIVAASAFAGDETKIVNSSAEQLDWETTDEGVGFAPLMGDRFVESYMAMVRLPAGLVSPAHVKTSNMFGVVVSGTMTHIAVGEELPKEVLLAEGSFYKIPAGLGHISKCVSEVDCITFLYQDGKFDFLPTDP